MIRPVMGTIAARVAMAASNLLLVAIAAQSLGLADVGRISLIVLGITFILLINHIIGGSGLVYLEPRHGTATLRAIAYAWAALTAALAYIGAKAIGAVPDDLLPHVVAIAVIQSVSSIHLSLLLGRERYAANNGLQTMRSLLLLVSFALLLRHEGRDLMDYVLACYIADGVTALLSGAMLLRRPGQRTDGAAAFMAMLRQGAPAQLANGLQLLNYRFSYYLIDRFQGATALGLWSITTQLAESTWLAPKSLGTVLYARVSNLAEMNRQRDLTLAMLKLSVGVALFATIILIALPSAIFKWVFGPDVHGIQHLVLALCPGLLAMAASQALSHFLSGVGRVHKNTIASGIGLCVTIVLGVLLIPEHGAAGAAWTASVAYCASVLYQMVVFNRITRARLAHYLPDRSDAANILALWRRISSP